MAATDPELTADLFSLLHVPKCQVQDAALIDAHFRELQARVHPDKHMQASAADQRLAMQWATRINEAYQTLKSPLKRARYLLGLLGHDVASESNTAMSPEFLMVQMELREAVAEARAAEAAQVGAGETALESLDAEVGLQIREGTARLSALIDQQHDYAGAAQLLRQLMFQEKLRSDIADALDALNA